MNKRKLNMVGTDVDELKNVIGDVVDDRLQAQADKEVKKQHINKALKKDVILEEKAKIDKHAHSCPTCHGKLKDDGKNFEVCEGCGDTVVTFKKDEKILVCSSCGNAVSQSSTKCPNCGSTKAHWLE